jgi:hypothetical protein
MPVHPRWPTLTENIMPIMPRIILTALGSALVVLSVANPASAAQRHHARHVAHQPAVNSQMDVRDSYAEFGPLYRGYDARLWGGAISAPAGR